MQPYVRDEWVVGSASIVRGKPREYIVHLHHPRFFACISVKNNRGEIVLSDIDFIDPVSQSAARQWLVLARNEIKRLESFKAAITELKIKELPRMTREDFIAWRRKKRLKQFDVAKILGIGETALSRWETGLTPPTPYLVYACHAVDLKLQPWQEGAQELRRWREEIGLSPRDAARLLGVKRYTLNKWEDEIKPPKNPRMLALACAAIYHEIEILNTKKGGGRNTRWKEE